MADTRYPLHPLLKAIRETSTYRAAQRLHVSGSTLRRLGEEGVPDDLADTLAVRAGLHPASVWPE